MGDRKTQTVDDVKETLAQIRKADVRVAMVRAMLRVGNLTPEARVYLTQEYGNAR
jgi:hypothetical protein